MDHLILHPNEKAETESTTKSSGHGLIFWLISGVLVLLALLSAAGIAYVYLVIHPYESYDKILPNVYCAGIDLGGMSQDEAQKAVEQTLSQTSYQVTVNLPDGSYVFQPSQEGITLNGATIAQRAYAYGRSDKSAFGMYRAYQRAKETEYNLSAETALKYSLEDVQAQAVKISRQTYHAPTESKASCDYNQHTVTVSLGQPGWEIEADVIAKAVQHAFDYLDFSEVNLEYKPIEIDLEALRSICRDAAFQYHVFPTSPVSQANLETHTIDVTIGTPGWKLDGDALYALAMDAVEQKQYTAVSLALEPVAPLDVDITEAYQELVSDPTEPYYYGGSIYEGEYGYRLDWDNAISEITSAEYGQQLSIPMTAVAPKHTAEEFRAVLFRDELSSYSTPHVANADRTNNLTLACRAIDGTVINAGEVFSFNNVVGERTSSKGYRTATVYVGSDSVEQVGGGICQVASTIYDAALYAEMEITSRDCHTFFVTYVPGGLDATVYWDALDFAFRNSTEYPIRVNAWVSGGSVHISIDGTKTTDHVVELASYWLSTENYSTVYRKDSSKPAGYERETVYPYTGYTYEAYQYIYDSAGNLLESNYLGKSTYEKRDRVITIGTG